MALQKMLKCIYPTEARKLGVIAATYRAGSTNIYSTCPATCGLLPDKHRGTLQLDTDYLTAEKIAVPRNGIAWTYTHFPPNELFYDSATTINISTDTLEDAITAKQQGFAVVYAAPATDVFWPRRINGTRFVRCPAELHPKVTCQTCGGGHPLCARPNRDYVIVFVAHGSKQQLVGSGTGGCYAAQGPSLIQWKSTQAGTGNTTWDENLDPDRLLAWVKALPTGTLLRHRITGDLGLDITQSNTTHETIHGDRPIRFYPPRLKTPA